MPPQIFLLEGRVAQQLQEAIAKLRGLGEAFTPGFPLRQRNILLKHTDAAAKAVWATRPTCATLGKTLNLSVVSLKSPDEDSLSEHMEG